MAVLSAFWSLDHSLEPASEIRSMLSNSTPRDATLSLRVASTIALAAEDSHHAPTPLCAHSTLILADVRLTHRAQLAAELGLPPQDELTDDQLLLAAWHRWREHCTSHLRGGFAFIVWEPARRILFAARDHTGERPLFYVRTDRFVALCSSQSGLLRLPHLPRRFNQKKIVDFFTYSTQAAHQTYFDDLHRLPPATSLTITPASQKLRRYWNPLESSPIRLRNNDDYAEALADLVDASVADCLPAHGPVASHLTAGLDSSSVTASAALQLALEYRKLYAFTAVPRPGFSLIAAPLGIPDEGPAASDLAALYPNIHHRRVTTAGRNPVADMAAVIAAAGEPIANLINHTWMLAIFNHARHLGLKTLLTGQAGNATISYEGTLGLGQIFRSGRVHRLLRHALHLRLNRQLSIGEFFRTAFDGVVPSWARQRLLPPFHASSQPGLSMLAPALVASHSLVERARHAWYAPLGTVEDERRQFAATVDLGNINAAFQTLTDINSLDPTADKRLYDFCYSIPIEQFFLGGHTRSLVRRAMHTRLPAATIKRHLRGMQAADWHLTLAPALPHLHQELELIEQSPAANSFLDLPYLRRLIENFPAQDPGTRENFQAWNIDLTKGVAMGHFLRTHEYLDALEPIHEQTEKAGASTSAPALCS